MPRKLDQLWSKFDCIKTKNTGLWARCKKCKKEMQGILRRMDKHNKTCQPHLHLNTSEVQGSGSMPASVGVTPQPSCSYHNIHTESGLEIINYLQPQISHVKLAINNDSDAIITTKQYSEKIDKQIGKYFYATNTPFRHADHSEFKNLCSVLRPGYKAPSSNQIGSSILELVYTETLRECKEKVKGKTVCMSLHGWGNDHNEPMVCITTSSGDSILVDTIDTGASPRTSENLKNIALDAIKRAEETFQIHIKSYVTDNVEEVSKMRRELSEEMNLLHYGCSAHILELLAQDLEIPAVISSVMEVTNYFRNEHLPSALYKQAGGRILVIPQEVRWNTMYDAIRSYLDNREFLVRICQDHKSKIENNIVKIVNDDQVTMNAVDFLKRISPIAMALDNMQSNFTTIAMAVEIWHNLQLEFENKSIDVKRCFTKRKSTALYGAHYAANMIDHRFLGKNLSNAEKNEGFEYINEIDKNFVPFIMALLTKSDPFPKYIFGSHFKNTSPLLWWNSVTLMDESLWPQKEKFLAFCTQHLTATASTAALERQFSSFGLIQSKLRNRLGNDKAEKLVFMFKYFNQEREKTKVDLSSVVGDDDATVEKRTPTGDAGVIVKEENKSDDEDANVPFINLIKYE